MITYGDLCTVIIGQKINSIGPDRVLPSVRALGINVDASGKVAMASKEDLEALVLEFKKMSGQLGVILARIAIRSLIENETIEIPAILR
jgi:energy-converting hydrogenase Eha subunit E